MDEEEEQLSRRRGILMRTQHVIALSGPPPLVIVRVVTMQPSKQHFFLRPTAIPLEQKLTQNPPESPLCWHTQKALTP